MDFMDERGRKESIQVSFSSLCTLSALDHNICPTWCSAILVSTLNGHISCMRDLIKKSSYLLNPGGTPFGGTEGPPEALGI